MPGEIPVRAHGDGTVPVEGWTGANEWIGFLPFEDLPHRFNPPEGYIVTANHAVVVGYTVLGLLILYYMLKEGGAFVRAIERRMVPGRATQLGFLVTDAATVMRRYWLGRTIVSAVVAGVGSLDLDDVGAER